MTGFASAPPTPLHLSLYLSLSLSRMLMELGVEWGLAVRGKPFQSFTTEIPYGLAHPPSEATSHRVPTSALWLFLWPSGSGSSRQCMPLSEVVGSVWQ